jgi:hypothetical protein
VGIKRREDMDIREKIARIIRRDVCDTTYADMAENILALLKEEGWKSPSDIQKMIDMVKLGMEAQ